MIELIWNWIHFWQAVSMGLCGIGLLAVAFAFASPYIALAAICKLTSLVITDDHARDNFIAIFQVIITGLAVIIFLITPGAGPLDPTDIVTLVSWWATKGWLDSQKVPKFTGRAIAPPD